MNERPVVVIPAFAEHGAGRADEDGLAEEDGRDLRAQRPQAAEQGHLALAPLDHDAEGEEDDERADQEGGERSEADGGSHHLVVLVGLLLEVLGLGGLAVAEAAQSDGVGVDGEVGVGGPLRRFDAARAHVEDEDDVDGGRAQRDAEDGGEGAEPIAAEVARGEEADHRVEEGPEEGGHGAPR
jgi:hypothetical protein